MSALNRFHETASDALEEISACLPAGAKLCLAIYTPEKPELDIVLQDKELDLNGVVSTLRRRGLSIDGDNVYKRDLLDAVVGALALGAQNSNPPPAEHWGQRFWDIGREERGLHEELVAALKLTRENLRACQATIRLAGGFDPAYVDDVQAAIAVADAVLAKAGA
ncbi:hypothetical protein PseuLF5_02150 [Pseudomonas sp. LF-5]|uniref:hypothetical protein n=1 Tax=Pseudomonas sp. LF-5 TaxID=3031121 RepID=UPI00309EE21F